MAIDITDYNAVNDVPDAVPSYKLRTDNMTLIYYFDETESVYMKGEYDPNYHFWFSKTSVNDVAINDMIINEIVHAKKRKIMYDSYGEFGDIVSKLNKMYRRWVAIKDDFKFTASNLKSEYESVKEKCCVFESDTNNLIAMREVREKLLLRTSDPGSDYYKAKEEIDALEKKDFLFCSDKEEYRNLYLELCEAANALYGRYMSYSR